MTRWCGVLFVPATLGAQAAARVTVGPNVHVSAARPNDIHDEVLIAGDPFDASHLLACSTFLPASGQWGVHTVVYASFDGGTTWAQTLADSTGANAAKGEHSDSQDPACTYGIGGMAFFTHLPLHLFRSTDAGRTWSRTSLPTPRGQDRDYVVVDQTNGKYRGRVYVYAQMPGQQLDKTNTPNGISLWTSRDSGKTFDHAVQRFPENERTPYERTAFH